MTSHANTPTQIAGDIEANAKNLVDVLSLQSEELGVVSSRLQHIKFQLRLVKETHATVELNKLRAAAEQHIRNAMKNRRPGQIAAGLDEAKRARLKNSALMEQARALLAELRS